MKIFFTILLMLLVLIIGFRLTIDDFVEYKLNKVLTHTEGYGGHIDDVSMNFVDGNYMVKGLELKQLVNDTLLPFINVDSVRISIQWKEVIAGKVEGTVEIYRPKFNILLTQDSTKSTQDIYWGKRFINTVPFNIEDVRVQQGKITYTNYMVKPTVNAYLDSLQVNVTNLTNMKDTASGLSTKLTATAHTEGDGQLKVHTDMRVITNSPVSHTDLQLTSVDLTKLNDFIKAYGNFDVQQGTMNLYSQFDIKGASINGYIKPVFYRLQIFSLDQIGHQSLKRTGIEALLGLGSNLLENNKKDRLTTKVPIHGEVSSIQADLSKALESAMNN